MVVKDAKGLPMRIALVCSHGGHLTEMLELREAFVDHETFFVTYASERTAQLAQTERVYQVDNIGTSPWRLLRTVPAAWQILRLERPAAVVSTGSEIALPFFYLAPLLRIRTVFVESVCRVSTVSQTGRLVYPVASRFYVQWPELARVYGHKARYAGGLL